MSDCFYVPETSENLVPVSKLTRGGANIFLEKSHLLSKEVGLFIHLLSAEIFSFGRFLNGLFKKPAQKPRKI